MMRVWRLFVWRLSVAYIGPKSSTDRSRKTEIGTEVADVTGDSDITFKVKRSKVNLQGAGHIVTASPHSLFEMMTGRILVQVNSEHVRNKRNIIKNYN